jgi:endonuclease YncB( thermonuclease family)
MPFFLIKGHYRPKAGIPDGDSVRFLANNLALWGKLDGYSVRLGTSAKTKDTVQLRLEGIDAIEKAAIRPFSADATQGLLDLLGFEKDANPEPEGYILARMTDDKTRRPICFAFAGATDVADGSEVWLKAPLLRKSANYRQMSAGLAYPLYYNTLFAELRKVFDGALRTAKATRSGYWPTDRTLRGVTIKSAADLATMPPVWPKLWRRLQAFLREGKPLSEFIQFLAKKNERVDILSEMDEVGLQDLVHVDDGVVRLLQPPENLRVRAKAGRRA